MGRKIRRGKKIGRCKLRNKQRLNKDEPDELKNAPHSFVFHRGSVGEDVSRLTLDFRKVMEPFTASSLKAMKANKMKDFLAVSGPLHVTHMCVFTSTDLGTYLKIVRAPRGPTLYFKVLNYSLAKDVISSLKRQYVFEQQFQNPPLLVLNNFTGDDVHLKLMTSMLQNMFPSLNLININLNNVRRCVLFNYNAETGEIDFRHYAIKVKPVNISKGVKKMIQNKVPNLSRFSDTTDFLLRATVLSESEGEDDPESYVTLPQKISARGNMPLHQSSVRLIEQGPRLTLNLFKIEEGFMNGEVLYHRNITKTEEEKAAILQRRLEKTRLKEARKKEQAERKRIKELAKQELKEKSIAGQKKHANKVINGAKDWQGEKHDTNEEKDDDVEWFKKEVGKAPENDLFAGKSCGTKRKSSWPDYIKAKRMKKKVASKAKTKKK
ncbi:hypothetical protein RUM43_002283 [Polyplax serrata]|uniref:Brix domain-containing protein n=1 Tax=Polyplax serrata TaxID=468196 RepID=A0AAN8PCF5_POLSC